MPAYKNKENNSWYVVTQYTDWTGERKQKCKRGFSTRREALEWEQKFQQQSAGDLDMTFEAFVEIYTTDLRARLKESTWQTKEHIIRTKILPYFGKRKINEITTKDVIAWQNELLAYRDEKRKPYSQTYLKSLHNQLSAIFNHAVRYYDLHSNPAAKAGNMGNEERREMLFWTKEEYQKFSEVMMDKPVSYYAFQMLYWTGIREGELLALTPADFDFEHGTVKISKTYQRFKGEDIITSPKTKKSNRTIQMPEFLCTQMQEFFKMQYGLKKKDRIFTVTKSYLHHEMDRGAKTAGVKRIRIHDLRHSHISLLIDMGFSAVAIADRVGHESIEITYRYAHLFPSSKKRWQANWTILTKERDIDVSKECRQAQPIPQYHCGIPGIAGRKRGTEQSGCFVGTSQTGILLSQVYGARGRGTAKSQGLQGAQKPNGSNSYGTGTNCSRRLCC